MRVSSREGKFSGGVPEGQLFVSLWIQNRLVVSLGSNGYGTDKRRFVVSVYLLRTFEILPDW